MIYVYIYIYTVIYTSMCNLYMYYMFVHVCAMLLIAPHVVLAFVS